MHRQIPVSQRLYAALFPNPTANDPPNFSTHLARNLVPEIRIETARFYGGLETVEARYPGLNYTNRPHIRRLCHFPHHHRLFRAIKYLGITDCEILDLARWEGTLWARDRYEKDEGITIIDTTGNDIGEWVDPRRIQSVDGQAEDTRIRAITTSTPTPVFADVHVPLPQSAISCELEVQGPERESSRLTDSPAAIEEQEDTIGGAEQPSSHGLRHTQNTAQPTSQVDTQIRRRGSTQLPLMSSTSELSRSALDAVSRQERGEPVHLPADLAAIIQELTDEWHIQQQRGVRSAESRRVQRRRLLDRIAYIQASTPSSLNLSSALALFIDRHLIQEGSMANDTASATTQTSQVITQPAA